MSDENIVEVLKLLRVKNVCIRPVASRSSSASASTCPPGESVLTSSCGGRGTLLSTELEVLGKFDIGG